MNSSGNDFERLLFSLNRQTFEHVRFPGIYVDDPEFLVVIHHRENPVMYLGGYLITIEELAPAILSHAAEYLDCGPFSERLSECPAWFVCRAGTLWLEFSPTRLTYIVK